MLTVLLFLWGSKSGPPGKTNEMFLFQPEDVCRLAAAIRRNLAMPHRLVAITDTTCEFPSHIEHLSLVEHFGELRALGGCWLRLKCFQPGMEQLIGNRCCWIDLDSIVTGGIDSLFDRPEPLVLYESGSVIGQRWNGSVILFSPTANHDLWTEFDPTKAPTLVKELRGGLKSGPRGTDQAWFHARRDGTTPHWTAADGILTWQQAQRRDKPPSFARLVVFPGLLKPTSMRVRNLTPWVDRYWTYGEPEWLMEPWAVTAAVKPARRGRFKSLVKMQREARAAQIRMRQTNATLG